MRAREFLRDDLVWERDPDQNYVNPLPIITDDSIFDYMDDVDAELRDRYITGTIPRGQHGKYMIAARKKGSTVEEVPINKIIAIEKYLNKEHLAAINSGKARSSSEMPLFYLLNGNYYAGDGNHRIVAAYLAKKPTITGQVLDVDAILGDRQLDEANTVSYIKQWPFRIKKQ